MTHTDTDTMTIIEEVLGLDSVPSLNEEDWALLAEGYELNAEEELDFNEYF